jgi:hypothetical protein
VNGGECLQFPFHLGRADIEGRRSWKRIVQDLAEDLTASRTWQCCEDVLKVTWTTCIVGNKTLVICCFTPCQMEFVRPAVGNR